MARKEKNLSGLFPVDDENYTFLLQDFCFHIMSPNKKYISKTIKPDENGLLHATTYDAHSIATYIAESTLPIHECLNLRTNNYMVCSINQFLSLIHISEPTRPY